MLATLALSGGARAEFAPVTEPNVRIESPGFSILPPPGENWRMRKEGGIVWFARQGTAGSSTHTVTAVVMRHTGFDPASVGFAEYATNLDVFAAYAKKATESMNPASGRTRIVELSVIPDAKFGYCVREHSTFEDHGARKISQVLLQEDWGYVCLHPDSNRDIIQAVFSERGLAGERDPSLTSIREQFFQSLRFRPLR